VIGGGSIYDEAVKSEHCKRVFMTTVHSDQFEDCDTHFPSLAADTYTLTASSQCVTEKDVTYGFNLFERLEAPPAAEEEPAAADGLSATAADAALDLTNEEGTGAAAQPPKPPTADEILNSLMASSAASRTASSAASVAATPLQALPARPSLAASIIKGMVPHGEWHAGLAVPVVPRTCARGGSLQPARR